MGRDGGLREGLDLPGHADIDVVHRDLALLLRFADLGGQRLQAGLVAVSQRQVAAARGKLERQRPADATGGAGYGGRCSIDRSHQMSLQGGNRILRANPYTAGRLWQSMAGVRTAHACPQNQKGGHKARRFKNHFAWHRVPGRS